MDENKGVGFYMKKINDYIMMDANEHLKSQDLTYSQMHILIYIAKSPEQTVPQKEIEHFFQLRHPTVVGLLKRMEKKGLLSVTCNPTDRRSNCISLLPKAESILKNAQEGRQRVDWLLTKDLNDTQKTELKQLLEIIYRGMYDPESEK